MTRIRFHEAFKPMSRTAHHKGQAFVRRAGFALLAAGVLLIVAACASQTARPSRRVGQCDPGIDKAVEDGDWEKALVNHEQLLSQKPDDGMAMYHLGYIWGQLGDRGKEIQFYEQAVQCGYANDDLLYFNMGMAKADRGDLDGALQAFETAVEINTANPENQFGKGLIYQASGRSTDAEHAWLRALALDPQHGESHLALARLYLDQSRWADARVHLEAIQKEDPDNEEAQELRERLHAREALEYKP